MVLRPESMKAPRRYNHKTFARKMSERQSASPLGEPLEVGEGLRAGFAGCLVRMDSVISGA